METTTTKKATVLGLGQMGSTLAKLLITNGYTVTVWNRTASRATPLIEQGAILATSAAEAIQASPLVVICVSDYAAANQIFSEATTELNGKTVIQLTTGSPQDATDSEAWLNQLGAAYIDGAIQVAPEQMARPDTTILVSGAAAAYAASDEVLKIFGGNIRYLGQRISAAAAMDLATLSYLYGSLAGFFHSVLIAEAESIPVDLLGKVISEIAPGFTEFIQYEAGIIQSGDFSVTQSPLSISVDATERILKASQQYGINTEVAQLTAGLLQRANKAGYAKEELASLIKVLRKG